MSPLNLTQSMDFKTTLAHISVGITFPQSSDNELGLFSFSNSVPIDLTIFRKVTAPGKQIPIITSLIFSITSSLILLGLPTLVNWLSFNSRSASYLQCFT